EARCGPEAEASRSPWRVRFDQRGARPLSRRRRGGSKNLPMALTPCLHGVLVAAALFAAGCTTPQSLDGWFEDAAVRHDADLDFPAAAAILEGFDEPRPNDELERGDRALYGVRLADEDFLVLFEVEGAVAESSGS